MKSLNILIGTIEKILIKDNYVYVVVREDGVASDNPESEVGSVGRTLIGASTPIEQDILLSEVLIPSNIRLSEMTSFPDDLIGNKCIVYMDGKNPVYANITVSMFPARIVSNADIRTARLISKDSTVDENSLNYLKKVGYKSSEIEGMLSEKYVEIGPANTVLIDKTEGTYSIDQETKKVKVMNANGQNNSLPKCRKPIIGIGGKL